jgi:hypothetical protein
MQTASMVRVTVIEIQRNTHMNAARVALAVERYRLVKGELPEDLAILVPQFMESIPIDPFDGKPLKYKKLDLGFVVYSVGADEQDDGGKERQSGTSEPWDITFIIER